MEPSDVQSTAAETVESVAPQRAPGPLDLEDPSLYFNRELSWLDFNDRVLQLAEDPSVPLMERVKFCAIWESNLDEFYMVRVANLHDQLEAGLDVRAADGMGPSEQIDSIRQLVIGQRDAPHALLRRGPPSGTGRARDQGHLAAAGRRGGARRARPDLREQHLPGTDPACDRPRAAVPIHLEPVSEPGGDPPRSRSGHRGRRSRQGAEGAARPLRRDGRRRADARPAGGRDRGAPPVPVPGDGGHRLRLLPRHPRHRLRRLGRGRRHAPGGGGGASPSPVRGGCAPRGRANDERPPPRSAEDGAEDRRAAAVRVRRPARHVGPVGRVRGRGLRRASRPAVQPRHQAPPPRRGRAGRRSLRGHARGRRPRASPL